MRGSQKRDLSPNYSHSLREKGCRPSTRSRGDPSNSPSFLRKNKKTGGLAGVPPAGERGLARSRSEQPVSRWPLTPSASLTNTAGLWKAEHQEGTRQAAACRRSPPGRRGVRRREKH